MFSLMFLDGDDRSVKCSQYIWPQAASWIHCRKFSKYGSFTVNGVLKLLIQRKASGRWAEEQVQVFKSGISRFL